MPSNVFNDELSLLLSLTPETIGKVWSKEDTLYSVVEDHLREHLNQLNIRSRRPDGMHPQMLWELADVTVTPFLVILKRSCRVRNSKFLTSVYK